jgi:hypothetical protein
MFELAVLKLIFLSVHCAASLAAEQPSSHKRWSIRKQSDCFVLSTEADTATDNVFSSVADAMEQCSIYPCVIDVDSTEAYGDLMAVCEEARAALHVFSLDISCEEGSYEINGLPLCMISEDLSSVCSVEPDELALKSVLDIDGCTHVASHKRSTDFDGSGPSESIHTGPSVHPVTATADPSARSFGLSCFVGSSAVGRARVNLDNKVLAGTQACTSNACMYNVETYSEYHAMKNACESARGAFHLFSMVLVCASHTFQFNDYPECLISESQDPECTTEFSELYMEALRHKDGCTESATHTAVIDFYGINGADTPPVPPTFPTHSPVLPIVRPAALPAAPSNSPSRSFVAGTALCEISADGVVSAVRGLGEEVGAFLADCLSSPCIVDVNRTHGYSNLKEACRDVKGAFHENTIEVSCSAMFAQLSKYPVCWVSEHSNPACDPDLFANSLEFLLDVDNCTDIVTHTRTIDFFFGDSDDPDSSEAPNRAPAGTEPTPPPQASPLTTSPSTFPTPSSSAWSATAQSNSYRLGVAFVIVFIFDSWI